MLAYLVVVFLLKNFFCQILRLVVDLSNRCVRRNQNSKAPSGMIVYALVLLLMLPVTILIFLYLEI